PNAGEADCRWEFRPGVCANPRTLRDKQPIPEKERSPDPIVETKGDIHTVLQKVFNGAEYATVWQEAKQDDGRRLCLSVAWIGKGEGAVQQAEDAVAKAIKTGMPELNQSHREFWHAFYPGSFLSIPDTRLESFYWLQLYK